MNALRLALLLPVLAIAACGPREAPPELAIAISPQCTTCDDFVRCTRDLAAPGADEGVVVYHLAPKSAAAQLATIFDYLTQLFRQKQSDRRPLSVYRPEADGGVTTGAEAVLDLVGYRIEVPGAWIDQRTGQWFTPDDAALGRCVVLPRAEGLALRDSLGAAASR